MADNGSDATVAAEVKPGIISIDWACPACEAPITAASIADLTAQVRGHFASGCPQRR